MKLLSVPFSKLRVPVEVAALLLVTASQGVASTSPSWSEQPTWNDESPTPPPAQTRKRRSQELNSNLAPFAPGTSNLALDVGQVFLMGDMGVGNMGYHYTDSIGAQLHYTYGVSDLFGFDTSLGFSDHSNGQFSMTTLLAGMRTNLAWYDKVVPYIVYGLGFYRPAYQFSTGTAGGSTTVAPVLFGVHAGPGVDLELTKSLFFGASLIFHDAFGTAASTPSGAQFNAGGMFASFLLHAGMTF